MFIKTRNYNNDKIKEITQVGDYFFYVSEKNDILLGGINLINLQLLHPILFIYQLKFVDKLNGKEKEHLEEYFNLNQAKNNEIYSVGLITLNSLRNFKYSENLNILSLYFLDKEDAFITQDMLERFKYEKYFFKATT